MGIKVFPKFYQKVLNISRTANQDLEENVRNDRDSDFHIIDICGTKTSTYQIQLRDSGSGRSWSDSLMNDANAVGIVTLPWKMTVPRIVKANSSIIYRVKDTSGSGNTIQIVLKGFLQSQFEVPGYNPPAQYNPNLTPAGKEKFSFAYTFEKTYAAAALNEDNIKISSGHDFVVTHIVGNMSDTNYYNLMIRDSGSNEFWHDLAMRHDNYVGTAQYPVKLPRPRLVKGGSTIFFQVTPSSATSNTIQIVLHGYEIPLSTR